MLKVKGKVVYDLIPQEAHKGANQVTYALPEGYVLAKRVFSGTLAQLAGAYDRETHVITLSKELNYFGMEIVGFGKIPASQEGLKLEVGKNLLLSQHSELTMVRTNNHDDSFVVGRKAKERLITSNIDPFRQYFSCGYGITPMVSILSVVDVSEEYETKDALFVVQ